MTASRWWARGLLFENCNCQAVCPGHVHFDQVCWQERCIGWWAVRFDEGEFEGVSLAGRRAVIAYETPPHMIEGGWVEVLIIDDEASEAERRALQAILDGSAGGPWAVLARFVGEWLPTRYLPIRVVEGDKSLAVEVDGVLEGRIEELRGRDRSRPVTFDNMFNQIHDNRMVIAKGDTRYDDGRIRVETRGTHGLYSRFDWAGGGD